ncbi:MAG TPA: EscU/YscU/HrcU family type III secretion system export apparatus switch protein [Tepiditoga sp.]|nr:EscU/YscU/HrcU family type III secretion system export apparatus switch protein [Tepiditoga sp.]
MKEKKAIAISYNRETDTAPKVVAKGAGIIAEKIIEVAKNTDVPIIEDKNKAEEFYGVDLNVEIPKEMYKVAAEILAFIYSLDKKKR